MLKRLKIYLDTVIISALVKQDLAPVEMAALFEIVKKNKDSEFDIVTSKKAHDEIEKLKAFSQADKDREHIERICDMFTRR